MKLDDRPVIDQLTEPTPLNHLGAAQEYLNDVIRDREASLRAPIETTFHECFQAFREALVQLDTITGGDLTSAFDEDRKTFVVLAAADECDRRIEIMDEFADDLEWRLEL